MASWYLNWGDRPSGGCPRRSCYDKYDNSERGNKGKERGSHVSVEIIASDKERYIRVAAIDIVSSAGIRNICFMKRYEKPVLSCDRIK